VRVGREQNAEGDGDGSADEAVRLDVERVEPDAEASVQDAVEAQEEANGARTAIEKFEQQRQRDQVEEFDEAEIEARALGEIHGDKGRRGEAAVVVRQRAAEASDHPREGHSVGDHIEPVDGFAHRQAVMAAPDDGGDESSADASSGPDTERGMGAVHDEFRDHRAHHGARVHPKRKAEHLFHGNALAVGSDHQYASA